MKTFNSILNLLTKAIIIAIILLGIGIKLIQVGLIP